MSDATLHPPFGPRRVHLDGPRPLRATALALSVASALTLALALALTPLARAADAAETNRANAIEVPAPARTNDVPNSSTTRTNSTANAAPDTALSSESSIDTNSVASALDSTSDAPATVTPTNASPGARADYPSFRIISERNIFNPTRTARGPGSGRPRETRRAPKVESISLVGTMAYAKGRFAFFDGSSSEFRKVLQTGGTIAGHTIDEISQNGIRLRAGDQTLDLMVSRHLRREDDGEWQLSDIAAPPAAGSGSGSGETPAPTTTTPSSDASSASSSSGGGEVSDVLKRLMQQREKELK
ncbi:MAG: hypothetical protein IT580_03215 [Verrucomicrobiales bacterium]|nr:hypothetical protein [Verrucomicrobiales bacterium]